MRIRNFSGIDHGGEFGVPQLMLEADFTGHCRAVRTGQQTAFVVGGDQRVEVFADDGFENGAGQRFGHVAKIETALHVRGDFLGDAGRLFADQCRTALVRADAHHGRRFAGVAGIGAQGVPFGRALFHFMDDHDQTP